MYLSQRIRKADNRIQAGRPDFERKQDGRKAMLKEGTGGAFQFASCCFLDG